MIDKGIDITTLIVTLITVLGGTGGIKLFKRLMESKDKSKEQDHSDSIAFRKSLISRIQALEDSDEQKDKQIAELIEENFELKLQINKLTIKQ